MRILAALPLLLIVTSFAGCFTFESTTVTPACSDEGPVIVGFPDWSFTNDQESWSTAVWQEPEWNLRGNGETTVTSAEPDSNLAIVTVPPTTTPELALTWELGDNCTMTHLIGIGHAEQGPQAEAGKGALVYTAGFWPNGTMFYTNIEAYDDMWPERAGWYGWGGGEPLQVYVYDEDRTERPPQWGVTVQDPTLGRVDAPHNYFTTIPGFNEALKDLSTTTTIVTTLAPEDAYTIDGNEDHPLYGDAIVFLIHIAAVADQPCPSESDLPGCFRS